MEKNLDIVVHEIGFKIVEKIKEYKEQKKKKQSVNDQEKQEKDKQYSNEIDKVLGILANDGVYAYWVYCKSKEITDVFIDEIRGLKELFRKNEDDEEFFQNLSSNLHDLLFFKELLEKALTYARYHAKAIDNE
jgi:hypothetical protein